MTSTGVLVCAKNVNKPMLCVLHMNNKPGHCKAFDCIKI